MIGPRRTDATREGQLRELLQGGRGRGARGVVAFCVDAADPHAPLARAGMQLRAALGLGRRLVDQGYGVVVLPPDRWTDLPPDPSAVVVTDQRFDPALVPGDVWAIAWAVDQPHAWPRHSALTLFDAVLAGSALVRDRVLAALPDPERAHDLPLVDVLPLATEPLAPSRLERWRRRHSGDPTVVRDAAQAAGGIVPMAVYESLAAGVVPRTASRLGLADLGLAELGFPAPRWQEPGRGTPAADGHALAARVRRDHTWAARARAFAGVLERLNVRRAADAADAADGGRASRPTLGFFPDFRVTNPYQDMLYAQLPARGVRVAPVRRPAEQLALRDTGGDLTGHVLHVHWTAAVVQVATSREEAEQRLERFTAMVRDLKRRGGQVAWTVHNVLPHECANVDLEVQLCRFLAAEADLVHVMCEETLALTRPHYELDPARVEVVPHSSYTGIYPDVVSRVEARRRLGVREHDVALLALGGIRAYRGLDTLLTAFERLLERDLRVKLLVAGKPGPAPQVAQWQARCERHPRIVCRFEHVPEADLQVWNRAADIAVLPYRAILNSGAFKLAESFGLPIVAPRDGCVARAIDPEYAVGFDPDDEADLLRALIDAVDLVTDPQAAARAAVAARTRAEAYPPPQMARDFADALERRLLSGSPSLVAAGRREDR